MIIKLIISSESHLVRNFEYLKLFSDARVASLRFFKDDVLVAIISANSIRIYHEFEGRIEKSVLRIAVWHHEACRVMISGDP